MDKVQAATSAFLNTKRPSVDDMTDHVVLLALAQCPVAKHPHTHPDDKAELWQTCSNATTDGGSVMKNLSDRIKLESSILAGALEAIASDIRTEVRT
jgi:hypothetical protein